MNPFRAIAAFLSRRRWRFDTACVSDRGLVRPDNQDAYFASSRFPAFCVADGMGGCDGGAIASRWVCDAMGKVFARRDRMPLLDLIELVSTVLGKTNERVRRYAAEHFFQAMGSTVAIFFVDPSMRRRGVICHAGDSRIYRLHGGDFTLLTRDHTVGNELGRVLRNTAGLSAGDPSSRGNPLSHVLTRAVGVEDELHLDWKRISVSPGDVYLLCSDGVYDMVTDDVIRTAMELPPEEAVRWLSLQVRSAGATDNYTIICTRVNEGARRK